jgi:hypothetical protein
LTSAEFAIQSSAAASPRYSPIIVSTPPCATASRPALVMISW